MKFQVTLLVALILSLLCMFACTKDDPSDSNVVLSDSPETSDPIPQRESIVQIELDPAGLVCFFSADAWDDDEPNRLMLVNSDGSGLRELSSVRSSQFSWISDIELKPDLTSIAVIAERGGAQNIFLLDTTTGQNERLTNSEYRKSDITWSPNGQYIAYSQTDVTDIFDNIKEIGIINLNTREVTQLTNTDGNSSDPRWSDSSEIVLYANSRRVNAISLDGSSIPFSQTQLDSIYRSRNGRAINFDFESFGEYWDSQSEIQIETPRWGNQYTYLSFHPTFRGPAMPTPDGGRVILRVDIGGAEYFAVVNLATFACRILEAESTGYPYQSSTESLYWISNREFLFFGHRGRFEGFAILNIFTGQVTWLVNNENAAYDFKCWDYSPKQNSTLVPMSIDEICLQGIVFSPNADESSLLTQHGNPITRESEPIEPRHVLDPNYSDSIIVYSYPGLTVTFFKNCAVAPANSFLLSVEISSGNYLNDYGVQFGLNPENIQELFGGFNRGLQYVYDGILYQEYSLNGSESGYPIVSFVFDNYQLTSMKWVAYFD